MRSRLTFTLALLAALLLPPGSGRAGEAAVGLAAIPEAGVRVAAVAVRGNEQISTEAILALLRTRPGALVSRADVERDLQHIRSLGFFETVGPPEVELTPEGARITFVVVEYPRLTAVRFTGNTVLSEEELRRLLPVERGQVASRETILRGFREIEAAYRVRGYVARIPDEIRISPEGVLTVPVQEVRVADVDIVGLERVRQSVVEQALELRVGELFSERGLQQDFLRLQRFGLFERIEPEVQITAAGEALITWNLKEARSRAINFGLSYSPAESLVGNITFIENNFRGRAEQLRVGLNIGSIEGRIGGEVAYATPILAERMAYTARLFSLVEYRFTQNVLFVPDQEIGRYHERHSGVQAGVTRGLGGGRTLALNARFEDVEVFNLPPEFLTPDTPSLDSTLLGVAGQLTWDRRNSLIYPTDGTYASGAAEVALVGRGSEGGSGPLLKPQGEYRVYRALNGADLRALTERERQRIPVLAGRVMVGTALGDMPFFEQYFVGGASTVRGYREGRFWGDSMFVVNAELRWPFGAEIIGAAFVDAGHAWGSDFQFTDAPGFETDFRQYRNPSLQLGAGVGVRYLTPLGALRLDFAYGDQLRVHFTLGQTF